MQAGCSDSVVFDLHTVVLVFHTVFIIILIFCSIFIIIVFFIDNLERLLHLQIRLRKIFVRLLVLRLLLLDKRLLILMNWLRHEGLRLNGLTVNIMQNSSLSTLL